MIHPNRFRTVVFCSLSLLAGLLLTGCPPGGTQDVITITYDQVGACNGYEQTSGPGGSGPHQAVNAGPNAAFVAFRIVSFDNSKSSKDFNFDPDRLFINLSERHFMDSNLSLARDLGVFTAAPTTIPKGKIMGNNGITVTTVPTNSANGASEANNTNYFLLYDSPSGGVVLVKGDPNRVTWPQTDNCRAIKF
ncbi:MAG: hypothetical protein AABP62_28120 [Planctomycetota bacterium]